MSDRDKSDAMWARAQKQRRAREATMTPEQRAALPEIRRALQDKFASSMTPLHDPGDDQR